MRSTSLAAVLTLSLAACGGGGGDQPPDAAPLPDSPVATACEPPSPALPTTGLLIDPEQVGLPSTCVDGGLRDAPGRWFVRSDEDFFGYLYPGIEGDCDAGFSRTGAVPNDLDESDGYTSIHWSDGTRYYHREHYRFPETGPLEYEVVFGFAACLQPNGELAVADIYVDSDGADYSSSMHGGSFGPKEPEVARGLTLVGETNVTTGPFPITAYNLVVEQGFAYVVGPNGLDIVDVSDPATPTTVGHLDGNYNDVKVARGGGDVVAYLSPLYGGDTAVVNVTNPAEPAMITELPEYSHSVFIRDEAGPPQLYLATYSEIVPVYSLANVTAPVRVGEATVPGELAGVHDLFAAGTMIYANNTTAGLVAFDVSGGLDNAIERGRILTSYSHASWAGTAGGRPIVLHGDEGMTPDGGAFLRVLEGDLGEDTFADELGRYQSRPEVGIHNFVLVGDKVYIAYYHDGVRVVNVADPANPTEVAHYNTWDAETAYGYTFEGALGIRVVDGLIYVADSNRGLVILRENS
jgi:hypothetical protein